MKKEDWGKIPQLDWEKKWAAPFSLFLISYITDWYDGACARYLDGHKYHHVFINVTDRMATGYQVTGENKEIGEYFAGRLEEGDTAKQYAAMMREQTDQIMDLTTQPATQLLSAAHLHGFEQQIEKYFSLYVAMIRTADYIAPAHRERLFPLLEELRVYTEPAFGSIDTYFRRAAEAVFHDLGADPGISYWLTRQEFENYVKHHTTPDYEQLHNRRPHVGMVLWQGTIELLLSEEAKEVQATIESDSIDGIIELRGTVASAGTAVGVARIILDPQAVQVFHEGDILIAEATRPDYLPLMKKAAAIVTDGSGILSHAAVVARELKKPCVIGTKKATRVFKDGDRVEVDAVSGIVKKI